MEPRLYFEDLSYDGIGDFIASAVEKSESAPLYLLGKAAAYVDIAAILGRVTRLEAMELRTIIAVHAAMAEPKPAEYWEAQ
ncbi:hypothetical protein [uncultured Oscillibacter sp.]|uniref:hypothetical protein n=1 Tax=uncultured Oscillibacter sp. TaxID=876091 RepID=UPI0025FD7A7A|nr:hypothetical protein [uncultured Oscillibacter sp.]